jgi:hypothetical protein
VHVAGFDKVSGWLGLGVSGAWWLGVSLSEPNEACCVQISLEERSGIESLFTLFVKLSSAERFRGEEVIFLVTSDLPINQANCQKPRLTMRSKFLLCG